MGHIVSTDGVAVDPKKIEVVQNWPQLRNIHDVRSFLGLANFYHDKVYHFSEIAAPLTKSLKPTPAFVWMDKMAKSFAALKKALSTTPVVAIADPNLPYEVMTDASDLAIGAVLKQQGCVIAFTSHKLSAIQRRYPIYDKDFLAIIQAYRTWKHYLLGVDSVVKMGHHSLKYIFTQPVINARQGNGWSIWQTFTILLNMFLVFPMSYLVLLAICLKLLLWLSLKFRWISLPSLRITMQPTVISQRLIKCLSLYSLAL